MLKIASIIGARPQFIKLAALSRAIQRQPGMKEVIIHTGQHYDRRMSSIFFKELKIRQPDYNLGVGSHNQLYQTALMLEGIERVLLKEKPDLAIVYGDTNSTLAGALAARKLNIPTAHIEAGMRSYNQDMPEEINRLVVDRISDVLFCSSRRALLNLRREGIVNQAQKLFPRVFLTGDVMYDSLLIYLGLARKRSRVMKKLSLEPKGYYLATVHRAGNTDNRLRLRRILECLSRVATGGLPVVLPLHPRTSKAIAAYGMGRLLEPLMVIEPLSYLDMLMLERQARAVITDSGGVQKEAYFLKTPCFTLRQETEWPETLSGGWNRLVGLGADKLSRLISRQPRMARYRGDIYGRGRAADKIVSIIKKLCA
jgi:UDP-N-acetylglucosamine 2-epimerase